MPFPDLVPDMAADYRSPARISPDFAGFWVTTLAEARRHPLDMTLAPAAAGLPDFEVFDLTFRGHAGQPVRGRVIRPKAGPSQTSARSCAVKFIGCNGARSFAREHLLWPATGRCAGVMDTRGQGSGWAPGLTPDPVGSDPPRAGFMTKGILRRKDQFCRRVFTDAVRAVEAARVLPAIDPARVGIAGGSQGGGISPRRQGPRRCSRSGGGTRSAQPRPSLPPSTPMPVPR